MDNRVVVTGVGIVSPLGLNVPTTWQALIAGKAGADYITLFDTSDFDVRIAAEVKGFDSLQYIDRKRVRHTDRFTQLAIAAGLEKEYKRRGYGLIPTASSTHMWINKGVARQD